MFILTSGASGVGLTLLFYLLKMDHILILHMFSNFGLSPGCCKCYVMVTLDSIIFLQRVLICLTLEKMNLIGLKLSTVSLGQPLQF